MEKNNEVKHAEEVSVVTKTEHFIEKNKNLLLICVVAVAVVVLAIFGVKKWISEPRQQKANEALFAAEQYFNRGDFETALNGDQNTPGLLQVVDKYGSTKSGKRAKYEAGICYLRMGMYDQAKQYLKKYNGNDQLTPVLDEMCLGDAEAELGNFSAALKHYNKAAQMDKNFITAPFALFKAGMVYIINGDKDNAIKSFQTVKSEYPESSLFPEMDRYIAYAENM